MQHFPKSQIYYEYHIILTKNLLGSPINVRRDIKVHGGTYLTCFNAQSNGCRQYLAKRPRAHFFSMIIVLYNKYYTFAIKNQH